MSVAMEGSMGDGGEAKKATLPADTGGVLAVSASASVTTAEASDSGKSEATETEVGVVGKGHTPDTERTTGTAARLVVS